MDLVSVKRQTERVRENEREKNRKKNNEVVYLDGYMAIERMVRELGGSIKVSLGSLIHTPYFRSSFLLL